MLDWTKAKDYEIKNLLLDIWNEESNDIVSGKGKWFGVDTSERLQSLRGVKSVMHRILDSMQVAQEEPVRKKPCLLFRILTGRTA